MARPLRIEYHGALYHVTARGNARAPIFLCEEDRHQFLSLLSETLGRFGWLCHAYCLMDNHYHLMVETPNPNLSLGMQHLNGVYTQRFNRQHNRTGHLLQGRFKAIVVEKEAHLLELARYIVLNPVRAAMVETASSYPWSSYRATAGDERAAPWLTTDWLLSQFARTTAVAQRRYREFVDQGLATTSPWSMLKGQLFLGSEEFMRTMQPKLLAVAAEGELPRSQRLAQRPDLIALFSASVSQDKPQRDAAIRCAYSDHGYTMAAIARAAGVHYSTVSKVIKGCR
jgi:REP element-mobilizing transposase RayT